MTKTTITYKVTRFGEFGLTTTQIYKNYRDASDVFTNATHDLTTKMCYLERVTEIKEVTGLFVKTIRPIQTKREDLLTYNR